MSIKTGCQSHEYRCQFWRSCCCTTGYKLFVFERDGGLVFELFRKDPHTTTSHAVSKAKFLAPLQKGAIQRSLVTNSTATAKQIRQSTNMLLDEKEHIGPALGPSVERHVRKERNRILQEQMHGVEMSGKSEVQILRELCEGRMLQDQIKLHNEQPGKANHIAPNKMMVTSSQFVDGIIHWGMSTPNMLLNFARGINSGDKMTLCMDGTFGTNSSETCLYGVRYGMMGGTTAPIGYSINPKESTDAIRATFNGLQAGFFALLVMLNLCGAMCCEFCDNVRAILRLPGMEAFCASVKWAAGKLDVGFLMSDDGAGFKSWAGKDMPEAMRLKCFQHIGSKLLESCILLFGSKCSYGQVWIIDPNYGLFFYPKC